LPPLDPEPGKLLALEILSYVYELLLLLLLLPKILLLLLPLLLELVSTTFFLYLL